MHETPAARSAFVAVAALGAPALSSLVGLFLAGSGTPLPAGAFVLLPALLTGAAGLQLRRPPSQIIVGSVVAGVVGGLSLFCALAWLGPEGVLE